MLYASGCCRYRDRDSRRGRHGQGILSHYVYAVGAVIAIGSSPIATKRRLGVGVSIEYFTHEGFFVLQSEWYGMVWCGNRVIE